MVIVMRTTSPTFHGFVQLRTCMTPLLSRIAYQYLVIDVTSPTTSYCAPVSVTARASATESGSDGSAIAVADARSMQAENVIVRIFSKMSLFGNAWELHKSAVEHRNGTC